RRRSISCASRSSRCSRTLASATSRSRRWAWPRRTRPTSGRRPSPCGSSRPLPNARRSSTATSPHGSAACTCPATPASIRTPRPRRRRARARAERAWPWLRESLGSARLRELAPELADLDIVRDEFPHLRAVHFVLRGLLAPAGSNNLRVDEVGKAVGEYLRSQELEMPVALL